MSQYNHVRWVDLHNNGIAKEVLILREDTSNGDMYFIPVDHLDSVDKDRVLAMLRSRDAATYPLWEVMVNTTLRNGENALVFFHQLTKVRTRDGKILPPGRGRGVAFAQQAQSLTEHLGGEVPADVRQAQEDAVAESTPSPAKRGPGRPSKSEA